MASGRVLLLEDDVALRGLLFEALSGEGLQVRACASFIEMREAAADGQGDIVVADFWGGSQRSLPDSERQEIRELGLLLPVVLLTGRTWATNMQASEVGARELIRKPFDLDLLLDAVGRALADTQP